MSISDTIKEHQFQIAMVGVFLVSLFLMVAIAFSLRPSESVEAGYARPGVELVDEEGEQLFDHFGHWRGPIHTTDFGDTYTIELIKGWEVRPLDLGDGVMGEVALSPHNDGALYYVPKGTFSFGYAADDPSASTQWMGKPDARFYSTFWPKDTSFYGRMEFEQDATHEFYWEVVRKGTVHPSHFFDLMATMPEPPQFSSVDN